MSEIEQRLTRLLQERASEMTAAPKMRDTLRRARVRRSVNGGAALLSLVAVIGVSVVGVQTYLRPDVVRDVEVVNPAITTEGPYGFTSVPGEYPVIASGEFRGASWELTGTTTKKEFDDRVDVKLTITKDGRSVVGEVAVEATDDILVDQYLEATGVLDGANAVFGSNVRSVDSIEVDVSDGSETVIPVHRFTGYDSRSTITADYFLAFVPSGSPGFVYARDELGINLDYATYGRVTLAPHVIASGKVGEVPWSFEFGSMVKDRLCLVFAPVEGGSQCFTRSEVENAGPLLVATFDLDDVLGVVAILSDEVWNVRLERNGGSALLPWFQPPREDLGEWPLRLVAVGLEPGTHGALQAYVDNEIVAEKRF